jgi:3-phenylpropionate/trans-cinnamate dioxygenase ferredoxin reductase subunit
MISKGAALLLCLFFIFSLGFPILMIRGTVSFPMNAADLAYMLGKYFGIAAYFLLFFQFLWTAKLRFFERLMSFDRRITFHRTLGLLGVLAVTLHPVLILGTYAAESIPLVVTPPLAYGFGSFIVLLLVAGSTFLGRIWGVRYEVWKNFHWITLAVITLAFVHSFRLGSDMFGFFRHFWLALWILHVLLIILKFIHKVRKRSKNYPVEAVRTESPGVTSLFMKKPDAPYLPGQFGFLSVRADNRWQIWHPFSLTSTDDEDTLSMTMKEVGDFTSRISDVKKGDLVKLDVAYGGFCPEFVRDERYIMVAGGVGITPIYAMCKRWQDRENPPDLVLIYSAHHESEILFRKDFDSWFERIPNWQLFYVVTSQPDWEGLTGRLTPQRIEALLEGDLSGTYFLCGPLALIQSVRKYLISRGVRRKRVRREEFVFLP